MQHMNMAWLSGFLSAISGGKFENGLAQKLRWYLFSFPAIFAREIELKNQAKNQATSESKRKHAEYYAMNINTIGRVRSPNTAGNEDKEH